MPTSDEGPAGPADDTTPSERVGQWSRARPGETDLVYREIEHEALSARIYRPAGPGPFPGVISVHGGAWISGSRFNNEELSRELCRRGALVMAVDFRKPPRWPYPASVADVGSAVRWLRAHAAEWALDPHAIGGAGFSSGGLQLALAAMDPDRDEYAHGAAEGSSARLDFMILCYGVLDPVARFEMAQRTGRDNLLTGHRAYWPDLAAMARSSPMQRVIHATALPRALVVQGRDDRNLLPDMARDFAVAYRRAGGEAELRSFDDAPHGFLTGSINTPAGEDAVDAIAAFIGLKRRTA